MNVRVLGGCFNYVVVPWNLLYSGTRLDFQCHVSYKHFAVLFRRAYSYSLYPTHLTRPEFWVPARHIAYTNITENVIPLRLCKYTLFSKSEDHLFLQPLHFRSTRTIITHCIHTVSRNAIIFQADNAAPQWMRIRKTMKFLKNKTWKTERRRS